MAETHVADEPLHAVERENLTHEAEVLDLEEAAIPARDDARGILWSWRQGCDRALVSDMSERERL